MKPNSIHTQKPAEAEFPMPDDLTRLVPGTELIRRTLEAVQTFLWSNKSSGTTVITRRFNPRILLAVLTYSYATGLFGSARIVQRCEEETTFRRLSDGIKLGHEQLRLFRGQNSELVKRCLAFVIRQVCNQLISANPSKPPADQSNSTNGIPGVAAFWNMALSQRDAERRFRCAVQMDRTTSVASVREVPFGFCENGLALTA